MTEPGAGSDVAGIRTTAVKDGDQWILNGAKTFISNGLHAGLVGVVVKTDPAQGSRGISILMVEQNARLALQAANRGYVMDSGQITITGDANAFRSLRLLRERQ